MSGSTCTSTRVYCPPASSLTAPVWFACPLFTKALAEYRSRYPDVLLDLHLNDRPVDLVEEGFDLALRVTWSEPGSSLLTRLICPIQLKLVGSPDYLRRNGYPKNLSELSKHLAISYNYSPFADEIAFNDPNGQQTVRLAASIRSNNTHMLHHATLASIGLAILPEWLIADDLASQRLEVLKLDYTLSNESLSLYAIHTSRQHLSSKVRTFIDFLMEYFAGITEGDSIVI
jgi:DNA-binding transcriptional LysR family regulator